MAAVSLSVTPTTRTHLVLRSLASASAASLLGLAGLLGPVTGTLSDTVDTVTSTVVDDGVLDDGRALVHVADEADIDAVADRAAAQGLTVTSRYEAIGVFHAAGSASDLNALADDGEVVRLEEDAPIEILTDTSHDATRGNELLAGEVGDLGVVDGSGVGVAVVDTGVDGSHPDLDGQVGENVKVLPGGVAIPFSDTDLLSLGGHGTHVAGTVAGTGAASDGTYHGAATGATIHGVSGGTLISMHSALDALEWVLDNHDQVEPAIGVVNNSWGSSGTHDPGSATTQMVNAIVDAGVTVVFAAGNSGGDGSSAQTSPECTNPYPGVICVAAYDDQGEGTRDGDTAGFSSRGASDDPSTWPDLAAPGADIVAACPAYLPVCLTGVGMIDPADSLLYASLSGTSMAAPHIAGIAAQVLQVAPDLTPAEVEDVLVSTATSYGDPGYAEGAGLVDAVAAVEQVAGGSSDGGSDGGDGEVDEEPDRGQARAAEARERAGRS
jgi:serine protease AprX